MALPAKECTRNGKEIPTMMKTAIQIRSETHARLVKRLLEQNHIAFESRKKTTSAGCVTIFRMTASPEVVRELLRRHRIPYEAE